MTNLQSLQEIKQSLQNNTLDELTNKYCVEALGQDPIKQLDKKREKLLARLRTKGEKLHKCVAAMLPLLLPKTDNTPIFLPKKKISFVNESVSQDFNKVVEYLEKLFSSEDVRKAIPRIETCKKSLLTFKKWDQLDLTKNLAFAPHIVDMRLMILEFLIEKVLKLMLLKLNPGYLKQDEGTRLRKNSHSLDDFVEELKTLIPNLKIGDEAKLEIELLTEMWKTYHHYPADERHNSLNETLQILYDQGRMIPQLSNENPSKEVVLWFKDHKYGQDRDNWQTLIDDHVALLNQCKGVGFHSLQLIQTCIENIAIAEKK